MITWYTKLMSVLEAMGHQAEGDTNENLHISADYIKVIVVDDYNTIFSQTGAVPFEKTKNRRP